MDTFDTISKRASIREYKTKPISKSALERLVDAGRRAPTARAVEPWEFIVITKKEILDRLGEIANTGSFIKGNLGGVKVSNPSLVKYYGKKIMP